MKDQDVLLFLALGLLIWVLGTLYYAHQGVAILESTPLRYWLAFAASPVFSVLLCIAILRWRRIPAADWTSAMLLLAIPGMLGEAVLLTNFSWFMPRLQAVSGCKYAALLFMTYGVVLGMAEFVTLRAAP